MRVGQTSLVVFLSRFTGSALGFVATLYFARTLGADILGQYALILAIVAWLSIAGNRGLAPAITKRMSEETEPNSYASAGAISVGALALVLGVLVVIFRDILNAYVGEGVALLIVLLLFPGLFRSVIGAALDGEQKVHLAGLLTPVEIAVRSLIQISLVAVGFGLVGMIVGYATAGLVVIIGGLPLLSSNFVKPTRRHFEDLLQYAKFSWLGGLQSRSFNDVDVLLLGIFVKPSLVGVYSVAWSIATILTLFDSAVSSALFPELSRADAEERQGSVANLIEESLTYAGLILIPGLFGGVLLGEELLRIYGSEFVRGATVLWILILATSLYGYQKQLLNALNGIDRPSAAFRINAVFITLNIILNLLLISTIGFLGAAIATAISTAVGVLLSLYVLRSEVTFQIPFAEILRQIAAAMMMAVIVFGVKTAIETMTTISHNFGTVIVLVGVGVVVYFIVLFGISTAFRSTVIENSPV
jgi:O-antigen/teichoic acid export membrane protein